MKTNDVFQIGDRPEPPRPARVRFHVTAEQIYEELADYKALDQLLCCPGHECGCYGATLREEIAYRIEHLIRRSEEQN